MEIVLNRSGGVPVKEQLLAQLELKLLEGALAPGERLPSVRALARRLKVHPNTVSAAYQALEVQGQVEMRRGSGVFVRRTAPTAPQDAGGLDEMIRLSLGMAFRRGFSGAEIKAAVRRWLEGAPPDRVLVVEPAPEMGDLLVHELRQRLKVEVASCSPEDLAREPGRLAGALVLTLPYHVERVRGIAPGASLEVVNLRLSDADRQAILGLPDGAIVLVVSSAPVVLPFAAVLLKSLRGDSVHVEAWPLSAQKEWRRLVRAADVVFADVLSADALRQAGARKLNEVRIVADDAIERLEAALTTFVPKNQGTPRGRR